MNAFEIKINPKEIIIGGKILWLIETKERLYNGRYKIAASFLVSCIGFFFFPSILFAFIGIFLVVFLADYFINLFEYKNLSKKHIQNQFDKYYMGLTESGFYHSIQKNGKKISVNEWTSYDYLIDVENKELLILKDKNGGTNLYFKSWMPEGAFEEFKSMAYKKIKRKLNERFV